MRTTESLRVENDRRGYQELCSDCAAYGLKKHGLSRSHCTCEFILIIIICFATVGH